MMKELLPIKNLESAKAILNPVRLQILDLLQEPMVCADVAALLGMTQQRVNNHLKVLLREGLVEVVMETLKGHLVEKTYRSSAKSIWLSQQITKLPEKDQRTRREAKSLHNLQNLSERLQEDTGILLDRVDAESVPSIGVVADVRFRSAEERNQFTRDYFRLMHGLLEKYQGSGEKDEHFTAMLVCYPAVKRE